MTVKLRISYEVAVDSPDTFMAYGIALGYALSAAAANAAKIAEHAGAEVRTGPLDIAVTHMGVTWPTLR